MRGNIPIGLRQILEVYRLVRSSACDRKSAVKKLAQVHRVTSQTISSAITRNIGVNTEELEQYLASDNAEAFRNHLVRHFPTFQDDIEEFFAALGVTQQDIEGNDTARSVRTLFSDEKKNVLMSLLLEEVKNNLSRWLERDDIPEDLRQQIQELNNFITEG